MNRSSLTSLALLASLSLAGLARADIPPDGFAECQGKSGGAACTLPSGVAGTCTTVNVNRPDYSNGFPPGVKQVPMLLCVAPAGAANRVNANALMGLMALAAGMVALGSWWRRRGGSVATA